MAPICENGNNLSGSIKEAEYLPNNGVSKSANDSRSLLICGLFCYVIFILTI
jgi:hypothetical protein